MSYVADLDITKDPSNFKRALVTYVVSFRPSKFAESLRRLRDVQGAELPYHIRFSLDRYPRSLERTVLFRRREATGWRVEGVAASF